MIISAYRYNVNGLSEYDGWSGTNYNRPNFQRLLALVEEGKVAVIIVKDLSKIY